MVATEELVGQPEVEVQEAARARRDVGGERDALQQLARALPLADPSVQAGPLDALLAPIGGGGLICGTALAAHGRDPTLAVFGAEPEGAAETFESLRQGRRITDFVPDTICDGLRGTVGELNLALMREHRVQALTVSDAETVAAMRLVWTRLKIIVEPSCATVLAAVLRHPDRFAGQRIGLILSGGNVDLDALPW